MSETRYIVIGKYGDHSAAFIIGMDVTEHAARALIGAHVIDCGETIPLTYMIVPVTVGVLCSERIV